MNRKRLHTFRLKEEYVSANDDLSLQVEERIQMVEEQIDLVFPFRICALVCRLFAG